MPHPLSTIITAKLNGDDPHARTTITNAEAVEIRAELDALLKVGHAAAYLIVTANRFDDDHSLTRAITRCRESMSKSCVEWGFLR